MAERDTVIPPTYPELEHEVYLSLEPVTERPTDLPPLSMPYPPSDEVMP